MTDISEVPMTDSKHRNASRNRKNKSELIAELEAQDLRIAQLESTCHSDSDFDNDLFQALFEQFPLGITVEDYSGAKAIIDRLQKEGVDDLHTYLLEHPDILNDMVISVQLTATNENLIRMFHLSSFEEFAELDADYEHWKDTGWADYYIGEFMALLAGQRFYTDDYSDILKDGTPIELRCVTALPKGYEDTWARVITSHEDITSSKEAEQAIMLSLEVAQSENRAKSEFLANIGHELRTPLNAIIGFSGVLSSEMHGAHAAAEYGDYASFIETSGRHLLQLINDLLDLSKIEADKMKVDPQEIDIPDVIQSCIEMSEIQARTSGVKLSVRLVDDIPAFHADKRHIQQILHNLISNAVKFSTKNCQVIIDAGMNKDRDVVFNVADNGIGIAVENIPKVLMPFGQVSDSMTRNHDGVGLGLPIARSLIRLNGGHFGISSTMGLGTTVTLRFPQSETTA